MTPIINNINKYFKIYLPNIQSSWILIFSFIIGGSILSFASSKLISDNILLTYITSFIPTLCFIYIVAKKQIKHTAIPISKSNFGKINPVIFFAIIAISMLSISVIIDPLTTLIPMPQYIKDLFESLLSGNSIWQVITIVIAAPILEELLLRGVIERGIIYNNGAKKAIFWSAFLFAFIHLNPWQGAAAFIFGLFIGWIYWRTHSIFACIFIHFINNGSSILISKIFPNIPSDSSIQEILNPINPYAYPILFTISLLILTLSLLILNKRLSKASTLFMVE